MNIYENNYPNYIDTATEWVGKSVDAVKSFYIRYVRHPLQKIPADSWIARLSFLIPVVNNCFLEARLSERETNPGDMSIKKLSELHHYGILASLASFIYAFVIPLLLIVDGTRVAPSNFAALVEVIAIWSMLGFIFHLGKIMEVGKELEKARQLLKLEKALEGSQAAAQQLRPLQVHN